MKTKKLMVFVFGAALVVLWAAGGRGVSGAPPMRGDGTPNIASCLALRCDPQSGPVCGIDSSGVPRTFENRCFANLAYCREGRYYAVVKEEEC